MSLILMVLRKMYRNKLMSINMALTCILFIALMTSVPLYTDGVLHRMLIDEMEAFQLDRNAFPGNLTVRSDYGFYQGGPEAHGRVFKRVDNYLRDQIFNSLELPVLGAVTFHQTRSWTITEDLRTRNVPDADFNFRFSDISDLEKNIELIEGRMPHYSTSEGKYEVLVSEETMFVRHFKVGDEFLINPPRNVSLEPMEIVITGVFRPLVNRELLHLFADISGQNENIFLNNSLFQQKFIDQFLVNETIWHFTLDYQAIDIHSISRVITVLNDLESWISERGFSFLMPLTRLLPRFLAYREELIPLLFSLFAPIIIMLFFYLFMVSSMVVDRQKNEISVLKSRGAGRIQLIFAFLVESVIYGAMGLILGPILGIFLTRILGATTGFLEFVNRTALNVELNLVIYYYALAGAILAVVAILLPVISATKSNILEQKKKKSRFAGIPIWKRYFFDIAALIVSIYGLYQFEQMQRDMIAASEVRLSIDPLLFVVSTLFVMGVGLFFIRLFPLFIEFIYRIGKKYWPLTVYSSLIQVARSIHSYQFLMIFVVMTVSIAMFSATAARTINQNAQDRIRYQGGADHILMAQWRAVGGATTQPEGSIPHGELGNVDNEVESAVRYIEPDFSIYPTLYGVESATKVLNSVGRIHHSDGSEVVRVMGIEPKGFGLTAWFPQAVLPYHWFHYLNNLAQSQSMVLISRSVAERANLKQFDIFSMHWDPNGRTDFMVAGIIDYWPTWNPNHTLDPVNGRFDSLVVANIDYLQAHSALRPYEVWLNLRQDAHAQDLFSDIREQNLRIERISDTQQMLTELSREPITLGVNGSLTLVFIISVLITISGFVLFWTLLINSRMLQAGVMMAMGLKLKELVAMTLHEQILTSVLPMGIGVLTGGLSATLFIPVLQMSFSAVEQIPPFRAISYARDYVLIYVILGTLVLLGLGIISWMLSKLRIYSCIKLGED